MCISAGGEEAADAQGMERMEATQAEVSRQSRRCEAV
jgi:hypothetical protein